MKKTIALILPLLALLSSCGETSTSLPSSSLPSSSPSSTLDSSLADSSTSSSSSSGIDLDELNDLQYVFYNLSLGNFSVEYTLDYANQSTTRTQVASYTDYAIETDGFFGFSSVAQGDGLVFSYTRDADGNIESSAPLLNSTSGLRYAKIGDYRPTFANIDLSALPSEADEDGYYEYEFGLSEENDEMISRIGMLYTSSTRPTSVRLKPIGNSLILEGVGLVYSEGIQDSVIANFNQIGTTEINDVKTYLEEGGTAKGFISDRFVSFFLPYFVSKNYSIDVDLTGMNTTFPTPRYTQMFTEETEFSLSPNDMGNGYLQYAGIVFSYDVDENNDIVFQNAAGNGTDYFTDLWSEEIGMSFVDLNAALLLGYMEEKDGVTEYHLTDSQFLSTLTNLARTGSGDSYSVSEAVITIDDYEKGDFTCVLEYYDRVNHLDQGKTVLHFHDRDTTVVEPVERLLRTDDPTTQDKEDFKKALDLFGENNYSQYVPVDYNMALYTYHPDYTYYHLTNSDYSSGEGYIRIGEGVKSVTVSASGQVEVTTDYNATLPGTGTTYGSTNDLSYFSAPVSYTASGEIDAEKTALLQQELYDIDNYSVSDAQYGPISWATSQEDLIDWANSYFAPILGTTYRIHQIGFRTHLQGEDPSTKMNKLSYYLYVYDVTGGFAATSFAFFDLGHSDIAVLDEYPKA